MSNNSTFIKTLDKTDKRIRELEEQSSYVRYHYENGDMKEAYESALKLEEISERAVLLTRSLPAYTGNPKADIEVENLIKLCIPIEIGFTGEDWFSLRIPALLPKKEEGSAEYIRASVYMAMREFFKNKKPVRFENSVMIFRHIYSNDRPERRMRDHDNIEVNMISDIVAMYVMPDDGANMCSHYYGSAESDEERTEVYVVPIKEFDMWFIREKLGTVKKEKLYENRQFE